ncbi:hypothetical protein HY404_03165 [Candidatus Microgenomates bacterium]|nr:hypothetical protein [Candidatus Microgenomates bacterium]
MEKQEEESLRMLNSEIANQIKRIVVGNKEFYPFTQQRKDFFTSASNTDYRFILLSVNGKDCPSNATFKLFLPELEGEIVNIKFDEETASGNVGYFFTSTGQARKLITGVFDKEKIALESGDYELIKSVLSRIESGEYQEYINP